MASPNFATHAPPCSSTPFETLDALVAGLAARKGAWVRVPGARRVQLLRRCIEHTVDVAEGWVRAACRAKGLDPDDPRSGEEWLAGPVPVIRNLRLLAEAIEAGGRPPAELRRRPDGRWTARVFPTSRLEALMFQGITADVWVQPGREPTQGRLYRDKARDPGPGRVALVLGAGNVSSIGPMDALYKLFVDDEVVIVKTNPVNEYLQPYWEEAFRPLVDEGFYRVVRGGAEAGAHLVHHPEVGSIHLTGSDRTHDAIVWGADPEEQARRKRTGDKKVDKPITSELGAVTPVLVVPGPWSHDDLDFQARNLVSMVVNNGSFNCNAAKVVVTSERWPEREAFLARVEHHLAKTPPRRAYYPGAQARYEGFLSHYPDARPLGERSADIVPWTLVPDVPPEPGEYALTHEAFCGILAETRLPARSPAEFLTQMVTFANERCWGTLSCVILIHPATEKRYARELDRAIAELRYGGIAVNAFAGLIYALATPTWGAFPGHTDEDIQSGRGVVHNAYLIDHPEKSVLRAPFHISPTPAWFADHRRAHELGRALVRFEAQPGLVRLPAVLKAALRG